MVVDAGMVLATANVPERDIVLSAALGIFFQLENSDAWGNLGGHADLDGHSGSTGWRGGR